MNNKEIEYKYWAGGHVSKQDLSDKIDSVGLKSKGKLSASEVLYVISCDDYYINNNGDTEDFIRFRKGNGRYELTLKRKEKENVIRKEINLNIQLSHGDHSSVEEFLHLLNYSKMFQIYKEAWIWHTNKCDISFYTLPDGRGVIELEAVNYTSVKEGVEIIDKWEDLLQLKTLTKEPRSLYEIYTEENEI